MTTDTTTKDVKTLAKGLDGSCAQQAEAIAVFVDGRIKKAAKANETRIVELSQRVEDALVRLGNTSEVKKAATEVREAAQAAAAVPAEPTETDIAVATARTQQAEEAVAELESEPELVPEPGTRFARTPEGGTRRVIGHNDPIPEQPNEVQPEPDSSGSYLDDPDDEDPNQEWNNLVDRVDNLELCVAEHEGILASAWSRATATLNGLDVFRRAAIVGLIVFVSTFVIYTLLAWMFEDWDWHWNHAVGVAGIVAAIGAAIVFMRGGPLNATVDSMSYAQVAGVVANQRRVRTTPPPLPARRPVTPVRPAAPARDDHPVFGASDGSVEAYSASASGARANR